MVFFPLLSREDDSILESPNPWGRPFAPADRSVPNASIYQTCMDNYAGGNLAARAFIEAGHREFLFIWGSHDSPAANERFQGFKEVLDAEGIGLGADRQLNGEFSAEGTYRAAAPMIGRLPRFTAVFASNDSSAIGFMHAAGEDGLRCPADYSIIGFDNNPDFSPNTDPPLTSFRQPVEDLGKATGRILLDLIGGQPPETHRYIFKPEFIRRASLRTIAAQREEGR